MKKVLFPVNVIAILLLVPALLFGYLHFQNKSEKDNTETVEEPVSHDNSSILKLVKSF